MGWMGTRDFPFGAGLGRQGYFEGVPVHLREFLERWAGSFSNHPDTRDVSSKSVNAWAFTHGDAVRNIDYLAERLANVLRKLTVLPD